MRYRQVRSQIRRFRNHLVKPVAIATPDEAFDRRGADRPVLLIYGLFATRRSMQVMERRLRRDGHGVFTIDLGNLQGSLFSRPMDELARHVADEIERLYARFPLGPLAIIGHSKGGLIATHYVKHLGGARRVRTLITLGTPHNGTALAYLGLLAAPMAGSVLEMTPLSAFIRRLRSTPIPPEVWFASLWSPSDAICPWPAAVVERGLPNARSVEVRAPHHELLLRKNVYDAIRAELRAGEAWARARERGIAPSPDARTSPPVPWPSGAEPTSCG